MNFISSLIIYDCRNIQSSNIYNGQIGQAESHGLWVMAKKVQVKLFSDVWQLITRILFLGWIFMICLTEFSLS